MFLLEEQIKNLKFKSVGKNVLISDKASIYGAENMSIGNNVRIDDFCILSGKIEIGNHVHLSAYCALYGRFGIKIGNFCGLSPRCILFSASDDFSGEYMISPMVSDKYINLEKGQIELKNYVQIGVNSIIMPNIICYEGSVCGAFSLVKENLKEWTISAGIPAKIIKKRSKNVKNLSKNIII